jgi:hypothetical protein
MQLQNYFAGEKRPAEATKFAREVCQVLENSRDKTAWRDSDRLRICSRLVGGYYMLEMQHAENQEALDGQPAREPEMQKEIIDFEAACHKTHELAQPLMLIIRNDADLVYFDCMSCVNLFFILSSRGQTKEADEWLLKANGLVPADFMRLDDPQRKHMYLGVREQYEKAHPKSK